VWKMVHSCLLWCLCWEMNDINFEDREKTVGVFGKSFYIFFFFVEIVIRIK